MDCLTTTLYDVDFLLRRWRPGTWSILTRVYAAFPNMIVLTHLSLRATNRVIGRGGCIRVFNL
jgi:hypothetical protein